MGNSILIIESHDGMRGALRDWLEVVFPSYCIRDVASIGDAVSLMHSEGTHVVVMDDSSVQIGVVRTLQQIKSLFPGIEIIVLAANDYDRYRRDVKLAGASACVPVWKIIERLQSEIDVLLEEDSLR